ncbi:MAG: lysylphosphatidylglycerol synthase domain-containing protein [Nocardioides sp.]
MDAVLLAIATAAAGAVAVVSHAAPAKDAEVGAAVVTLLGWGEALWRTAVIGALVISAVLLTAAFLGRRWALARDLAVALAVLAVTGSVLGKLVGPDWVPVDDRLWSRWGYPELRLAAVVAVATVAGPELVAPLRRLLAWLLVLTAAGLLALGAALPSDVLAALTLGLASALLVRVTLGSPAGVPPSQDVRATLEALGLELESLRPATRQELGSAAYVGYDSHGGPVHVRVLGRDAQDTQQIARRWRLLAYRDPPRSAPVGRLEQVEHEALATVMAARAGVRVPDVLLAARGSEKDGCIVTRLHDVDPLEDLPVDTVTDELLVTLWREVAGLHRAGITHGRLNASNVIIERGRPLLVNFAAATLGAPRSAIDIDVAELLVACAVLVGPSRALDTAVSGVGVGAVRAALPFLQRAALSPHLRDLARTHEVALGELRTRAAQVTGSEPVQLAELRRIRGRDLAMTAAIGLSAYLLISQLAGIGFATIVDDLRRAEPAWLVVGLVVAQVTFLSAAVALRGAVPTPLPLQPVVLLKYAIKFFNLTVPGSAGSVAATVRFVQRMGGSAGEAIAAGGVDDLSQKIVQGALVLVVLPFVHFDLGAADVRISAPDSRLVGAIVLAVIVSLLAIWRVPSLRAKVVPSIREGVAALAVLRDRGKRLQLFGGNLAGELAFALTLGCTCRAFGVTLSLADLLVVNIGASVLAGLIPAPSGVGAAEATLTAALVAFRVDQSTAFAVAITHRVYTSYLPPLWGYVAVRWLRRHGYL